MFVCGGKADSMQKLAETCIRRPVFATMLIVALMVLGMDAYRKLGVDLFPKVEFPIINVTTMLRGASPEEVETQVSQRLEEAVNTISGIDDLRSTSAEGISILSIQFVLEKDPEEAAQEVRDKVSRVNAQLPKDTTAPVIEKLATDASPILTVVVSSPRDLRETTKLVDDRIKKSIESISGVGQVRFVGERRRQIQIVLDGQRLYAYNLNIDQVRQQLAMQNVEVPGGNLDQGPREVSLRTIGRVERPRDFARIIVSTRGEPVRISDIGSVVDGFEEPRSLARLDGRPAVALEIRKQAGTNTLQVIRAVKERIGELRAALPADFDLAYMGDQSNFIQQSFDAVQEHLILGGFLAAAIVLLFIRSWRSTLIAAVAIPTSIISTYTLIQMMGFTLNQITMLGLTLMVGIVIDDAIVVLENIFRFMEEKKMPPVQAAIEGTRDIGLAVMATTFSLVIIFLPVALMGGIVGRFMSSFGYTAAFAIMVSLLVSFTLTPMLCSRFLKPAAAAETSKDTMLFRMMAAFYRVVLEWSMRRRWAIVALSLAVCASIVPLFRMTGVDFLPQDDQSEFTVSAKTPPGSSLEGSDGVFRQMEAEIRSIPGVRHLFTTIGADIQRQVDRGSILVSLVPPGERQDSQRDLMAEARRRLTKFRDLTIGVQPPSPISGAPDRELMFFLQGPDLNELDKYAARIKEKLAQLPGVVDLESSYEAGKPEVRVRVNRDKAADLNVSVSAIATALRTLVGGDEQATTYREGDDRYDVMLRVEKQFRNSPAAIERLYVPSATLGNVPLANVAVIEESTGPSHIERYNRQRQIMITGNVAEGQSLSNVLAVLDQTVAGLQMPPEYRSGLVGRSKELGRAASSFAIALLLSILFMYMILASQFESFIDPVTILLSLPLSVPFALLALVLARENYSVIYSSVGILVLFGIVKKNAILQIDHIKSLRREGAPRAAAILKGCEDRLRPILMTTAALVAGMIPLALGSGAGAATRRTVAIVVIGGQSLALLLTLVVTPVAYSLFDDVAHSRVWGRLGGLLKARTAVIPLLLLFAFDANGQQRKLSLEEAVELALKANLEIEIERTNVSAARESARAARAFLDPTLRWQPAIETHSSPTGSVLASATGKLTEHLYAQNLYFRQRAPWHGVSLQGGFENVRQSTNNPFTALNPWITPRLSFTLSAPVVRGRQIDAERADLIIRSKRQNISSVEFELKVIDVIARLEQAYYDLVAVRADLVVVEESVALARNQLERTRRMIESGAIAPVELAAAEAELERRKDNSFSTVSLLTQAQNALKALLAEGREEDLWKEEIIPTSLERATPPAGMEDPRELSRQAIGRRAEFKALALNNEINSTQKALAVDQRKPLVNLSASYVTSGLAGTELTGGNPFSSLNEGIIERLNLLSARAGLPPMPAVRFGGVPADFVGGYGQSLSNLFTGRYPAFQAGLTVEWNFRNTAAESAIAQTAITGRRLELQRKHLEQGIEAQVRNALQAVETSRQRIAAAEASARAAREKLESETRLFQAGESTNFLVLTRQNEFSDSRRRIVLATLEFNKSVARLAFSLGRTLETYKVKLP
jgi:HAE1 family hydrophobic/amphiphilic exporter-1